MSSGSLCSELPELRWLGHARRQPSLPSEPGVSPEFPVAALPAAGLCLSRRRELIEAGTCPQDLPINRPTAHGTKTCSGNSEIQAAIASVGLRNEIGIELKKTSGTTPAAGSFVGPPAFEAIEVCLGAPRRASRQPQSRSL